LRTRDESLTAEPGIDRHDQHVIALAGDLLERDYRRSRIERHTRTDAEALDELHRAMQMDDGFDMNGQTGRARLDKRFDETVGILDHQMHVERNVRDAPQRSHQRRPE